MSVPLLNEAAPVRRLKVPTRRGATRDNPHMTPPAELGVQPDLGMLDDPAVRDKVSQALQRAGY